MISGKHLYRLSVIFLAILVLFLSSGQAVSARTYVGPSAITINSAFPVSEWGTVAAPSSGVYVHHDFTNDTVTDGSGFALTPADINYFWNAMSTQSGGALEASPTNLIQNIYYRIDTFATTVISPGQLYNIQLNLGAAAAGKADHLLQIWVNDTSTPKVTMVLYSYNTPYPSIGAFTRGSVTGWVSNVANPYSGFRGVVDANAIGAYGKYDATHYGIEVKIPISWFGSAYGGLIKNDGTGAPTFYGVIFTSTGTLGAVGTVKDTIGKSDKTPVYFIVDPVTGETGLEDLKLVNIIATKTDSIYTDVSPIGAGSPGDVLQYTVTITNSGTSTAKAVVFQDTLTDPNLIWCDNVTVTPAYPFVNNSNGVQVNIGNMLVDSTVTIRFRAQIKSPLPSGYNKVTNQGLVSGSNFASVPTNDPDTSLANDATVTSVTPTDMVEPYKTWALTTDADGNGYPSPGDTLTYTVTIENLGSISADNATFTDVPGPNSTLVAGSVITTLGTVIKGNAGGDKSVSVNIGSIPGGQGTPVTVTFRVVVNNPLPFGVTQLSNQGVVSGSNFPSDPTDDPTDQSYDNPTVTPVSAAPLLETFKRYDLTDDADGNGLPSAGDNLTYIITIANKGNQNATGVSFSDTVDTKTSLVVGSTIASQGTVTSETATGLAVDIGAIPGGNYTVDISFKATIKPGMTGGISNQGTITADGGISLLTDDPNTHTLNDATYTALASSPPDLRVTKSAILSVDADNNGVPSPGDTLQYIVAVNNNGGSAATGVIFTDTPDLKTSLLTGSVSASQGTVEIGNGAGDTTVKVNIGILEGGAVHSIGLVTFRVLIINPFPVNTDNVINQGNVSAIGLPDTPTDDPNTGTSPDATVTTVYADPLITTTKTDSVYTDISPTGASPGDVLLYTITIANTGTTTARSVVFQDTITDTYLTLASSSVTTTQGTIVKGMDPLDKAVQVNVGDVPVGSPVTISFKASITNPLPSGVSKVTNQGMVSGSNFSSVPTDDPRTLLLNDATWTSVSPIDLVESYKTWALTTDADHNGIPSPGDTLTYTVILENVVNHNVTGVAFDDIPDVNSTLMEGSVTTTIGTVTKGNNTGDNAVTVNVGTIPGPDGIATITFRVIVNSPLPTGVTQLSNQGLVSGPNFPVDPTDDPTDQSYDNPTITPLTAAPLIEAYKRYELTDDVNKDGLPGPGDNLTYFITISNKGNQNATGVSFSDTVDTHTSLIVGTTISSQGTVTSETATGVVVNIGTIPGGNYTVTISFKVNINLGTTVGIYNQGTVAVSGLPNVLTDDPNTHTVNDKTYTSIALGPPELRVSKSALLAVDADNNNVPSPGDTLQYIVAINNNGGSAATSVTFTDTVDPNTSVVAGSTTTSQGTVTTETPTAVTASIGTLEAGTTHSICLVTFNVLIKSPLPNATTIISNQSTVTANGGISVLSDDPNTDSSPDATLTTAYAQPVVYAGKTDSLAVDADVNGIPSPGDTLQYTIIISNTGSTAAKSVYFQDALTDAGLRLADSVTKTQGTIVKGNTPGDNEVQVNVGDIPAGGSVTITFQANIDNPLPPGVNHFSNQGYITGSNFPSTPTDDPRSTLRNDATSTAVTAIPMVEPYKTFALTIDADNNGYPSPGDTLTYTITLENVGNQDAAGVTFTDVPDPNSTLVIGSVTTTRGAVSKGNTSGDNSVLVSIGTLPGMHGTATITLRVIVNTPLPTGITQLSNQGFASGTNFPSDPTDNPDDESYDNPTVTSLAAAPLIRAAKSYQLSGDANNNGLPDPGDELTYVIDVVNNGNQNASGVNFTDIPDVNTTLVVGSVTTSHGSVTTGNTAGDTSVAVNIGTLLGGGDSATISFKVTINGTPGLLLISNQGNVSGSNFTPALTDDPGTTKLNDATETHTAADLTPSLHVTKAAILAVDADNTGVPSPGDTIQYIVTINNAGNGSAQNVTFSDTPDPNTTLVVNSVSTTQGTIVSGNTAGDTSVNVNIGTLPGGMPHSVCLVTFKVRINSPFPTGVSSISNQGTLTASGGLNQVTDDPAPGGTLSPTVTTIGPSPHLPAPAPAQTPEPVAQPASQQVTSHSSTVSSIASRPWEQTTVNLPNITVQSASLSSSKVNPGTPITVSAIIVNKGTVNGSTRITVYVNGQEEHTYGLTVNSGSSTPVQFIISRDQPGMYSVYINGVDAGSFKVEAIIDPNIVLLISSSLVTTAFILGIAYIRRKQQGYY